MEGNLTLVVNAQYNIYMTYYWIIYAWNLLDFINIAPIFNFKKFKNKFNKLSVNNYSAYLIKLLW